MDRLTEQSERYRRIARAISYIELNFRAQPGLDEIARSIHLSRYHFERLFKDWVGITPLQFLHFLTLDYAKQQLREAKSVLDASIEAGLSGPGRLHDLFVTFEAMSPGEFKRLGAGLEVRYGLHPTPFGPCLLAFTNRGICHLAFLDDTDTAQGLALHDLAAGWPHAMLVQDRRGSASLVSQIFERRPTNRNRPFHLLLKGTNFQVNVWQALLTIPTGRCISYQDLATRLNRPRAFRAVASAVAANSLAYLIPCHRVILKTGRIHQYRWGTARKKALIGWEAAARREDQQGGRSAHCPEPED